MIDVMLGYPLYILVTVGLAFLLTAVFQRLRRDDDHIAQLEENATFDRRIAKIEADYVSKSEDEPGAG